MKKSTKHTLVFLLIIGLISVVAYYAYSPARFLQVLAPPGWEIYDQICGLENDGTLYTESSDFTSPRECKGVYWKVDVDEPNYWVPTIQVLIGDIEHVDFTGKTIPNDKPADTILFERGNESIYLDLHIYMYTVTIRTIADKYRPDSVRIWHETSWPHEQWDPLFGDAGQNTHVGKEFSGGVYEKFVISPWKGYTYREPPESEDPDEYYVLEDCWAGVMNAYVINLEMGQVANQWGETPEPDAGAEMSVKGAIPEGNQLPMFEDDGTFGTPAPTANWDLGVTPDTRIESTVVIYTPVELLAGAKIHLNWLRCSDDLYPCDVYVMYTVRVDVLTSHGFILQSAIEPPKPTPPTDFFSWSESFWESFLRAINPFSVFGPFGSLVAWLTLFGIIGIVVLILLAIFFPGALALLGGGITRVRATLSGRGTTSRDTGKQSKAKKKTKSKKKRKRS